MTILFLLLSALIGVPLFCVIGSLAIYAFVSVEIDISAIIIEMVRLASAPTLLAIPLFTFTGYLLAESKAPSRMVDFSRALFGWIPGGIPVAVFITCAFFTAFTGASGVTIIALGGLLYPILKSEQYPEKFTLGLLTCSGSVGLLLPPSLPLILYGVVSNTSISRLFMAGIVPEIMLITFLSIFSIRKGFNRKQKRVKFSFSQLAKSAQAAIFEIPLPFIVLTGIYSGVFTPTEAAAISAIYVLVVEVFIYKDISLTKDLPEIMKKSMILVGSILIILAIALGFTNFLVDAQVPMKILAWIQQYIHNKWVFLILLNILLLIVGCMMDIFSAIIVIVPLIKPIAVSFGVDPVHLGIIFLCNLEIGYSTPPIGINLFISSSRFNKSIIDLYKSTLPFLCILIFGLLLITYFPWICLGLEKLLTGTP